MTAQVGHAPALDGLDDPRLDALVGPERAAALRGEAPLTEAAGRKSTPGPSAKAD